MPDLMHAIDAEIVLKDPLDIGLEFRVTHRPI
jgi:hypothetical protein